jgi:putative copper resistance protein D
MQTGIEGGLHGAADAIHLLCGGYWIGALVALAVLWPAASPESEKAYRLLRLFSDLGATAVALVVLTGVTNALLIVRDWADVFSSLYGRVLVVKLALVACMIALALLNRIALVPAIRGSAQAPPSGFLRSLWTEIVIGGLVILAASLLGTVAPPMAT